MAEGKRVKVSEVLVGLGSEEWSVPSGTTVKEVIQMILSSRGCSSSKIVLEAHVDQDGSVIPLPDTLKLTEIEGWRYKARAEVVLKPRRFATGVAIQDPTECFFVEPEGAQALAEDLVAGRYCVVCDRRQSGKTTLLYAVAKRLEQSGLVPVYIGGLSSAAKGWTSSDMWRDLCRRLHLACPALFAEQKHEGMCDDIVFMSMFRKTVRVSCKVVVILDEADTLLKLDPGCLDVFFHTIKDMKSQRASYNLWAFALAGVETIKDLLEARYDRGRHAANEGYLESAAPSRLSPFPHDLSQALRPFTVEEVISLMEQANEEHGGKILQVVEVATHIWQQTSGHKGLVGTCLAYMIQEEAFTFKSWLELSDSFKLGRHLFGQATYARIMSFFRKTSTISQALYDLLVGFLEQEKRELQSVVHLRDLLAEGVLTAVSSEDDKYQVSISSPLLRTAILRRCSICGQQADDPPAPRHLVNRTWLVQQAIRTLDYDCICRPECSEYSHQFIFMCRVKAVLQSAYPFVGAVVLPEVKEVPVEGVRRSQLRLHTLVRDHQHFPRFGFEYVVDADVKSLRAHYQKSVDYSKQHSAQVYLINFTLRKDPLEIKPDDESIYFWGVRFDPEDQTATVTSLDATGAREAAVLSLRNWTGKLKFDDLVG
ncbi:hypothetical protein SELMODRAFT_409157 [Selaginella moellendorffii]|uniref:Uncharacterized protein n=1 Tax=Selaginella moellendorffii TaxID=88036 RepID=D8RAJ5_SELML|nr:hypothetical protein SELMODRAFT_409157 [Selaginella moellendorffii]